MARRACFARSEDKLRALVDDLGDRAMALPGDVTDLASVTAAMDAFVDKFRRVLDAAFANAGRGVAGGGNRGRRRRRLGADDRGERPLGRVVDGEGGRCRHLEGARGASCC